MIFMFLVNKWIHKVEKWICLQNLNLPTAVSRPSVARVCPLTFPPHKITRLYQNQSTDFENHDFTYKIHKIIKQKTLKSIFLFSFLWARRQRRQPLNIWCILSMCVPVTPDIPVYALAQHFVCLSLQQALYQKITDGRLNWRRWVWSNTNWCKLIFD